MAQTAFRHKYVTVYYECNTRSRTKVQAQALVRRPPLCCSSFPSRRSPLGIGWLSLFTRRRWSSMSPRGAGESASFERTGGSRLMARERNKEGFFRWCQGWTGWCRRDTRLPRHQRGRQSTLTFLPLLPPSRRCNTTLVVACRVARCVLCLQTYKLLFCLTAAPQSRTEALAP